LFASVLALMAPLIFDLKWDFVLLGNSDFLALIFLLKRKAESRILLALDNDDLLFFFFFWAILIGGGSLQC